MPIRLCHGPGPCPAPCAGAAEQSVVGPGRLSAERPGGRAERAKPMGMPSPREYQLHREPIYIYIYIYIKMYILMYNRYELHIYIYILIIID